MSGIVTLILLALLCAFGVRWIGRRVRLPTIPTTAAVVTVFVLVVAALYGRHLAS